LSIERRLAYCFAILRRRFFFSIELFFAIRVSPYGPAFEDVVLTAGTGS
jgi:hypothetical protein